MAKYRQNHPHDATPQRRSSAGGQECFSTRKPNSSSEFLPPLSQDAKNVRNMQGFQSQRDTGSRPRGPFPARAEGQGADHCPESQDEWVGSCWASCLPWGAGGRLPSLGPSFLICKLGVIKPAPPLHSFKLVQTTAAGHVGLMSSPLPQGSAT